MHCGRTVRGRQAAIGEGREETGVPLLSVTWGWNFDEEWSEGGFFAKGGGCKWEGGLKKEKNVGFFVASTE